MHRQPTITSDQAEQLAQLVVDHGDRIRAILGVRRDDGPMALHGIKLNRADQQMIMDVLAQRTC